MKKYLFLILLLVSSLAYGQTNPTINVGQFENDGTGDRIRNAMIKTNQTIDSVNAILSWMKLANGKYVDATSSIQGQLNALYDLIASQRANYYVDQVSGNDANTGLSPTAAWKTIAKVNAHTFIPGDNIFFKRGCTWREQLTIGQSGTSDNHIVISAYGTGAKPKINGANVITGWAHRYHQYANIWGTVNPAHTATWQVCVMNGVLCTQVSTLASLTSANEFWINTAPNPDSIYVYSTVDPGTITTEISARDYCIYNSQKTYISISDIECRYAGHSGIYFIGPDSYPTQTAGYSTIDSCIIYGNRCFGIMSGYGYTNNTITNCVATYNGNGIYVAIGADNTMVRHCYTAYNRHVTITPYTDGSGIQLYEGLNLIAEYNESSNDQYGIYIDPKVYGPPQDDYWIAPFSMTARYNYVHDAYDGIGVMDLAAGDVVSIYYNLIVNCGNKANEIAAIYSEGVIAGNLYIYNNTVVNSTANANTYASLALNYGANATIKNNIFYFVSNVNDYQRSFVIGDTGIPTSNYNRFYISGGTGYVHFVGGTTYTTIAAWTAAHSQDANSSSGDPLFTNSASDWTLQAGSACIGAGVDVGLTHDILGKHILGVPDMGCYEKQ
jgi:parallel beta-helix repeat protein